MTPRHGPWVLFAALLAGCSEQQEEPTSRAPPPLPCAVAIPPANATLMGSGEADDGNATSATYGPAATPPLTGRDGPAAHRAFARSILTAFDNLAATISARTAAGATYLPQTTAKSWSTNPFSVAADYLCKFEIQSTVPYIHLTSSRAGFSVEAEIVEVGPAGRQVGILTVNFDFKENGAGGIDVLRNLQNIGTIANGLTPRPPAAPPPQFTTAPTNDKGPLSGFVLKARVNYQLNFTLTAYGSASALVAGATPVNQGLMDAEVSVKLIP